MCVCVCVCVCVSVRWGGGAQGGKALNLCESFVCLVLFCSWATPCSMLNFPDHGLNLCPLHWKHSLNHWTTKEVLFVSLNWFLCEMRRL